MWPVDFDTCGFAEFAFDDSSGIWSVEGQGGVGNNVFELFFGDNMASLSLMRV